MAFGEVVFLCACLMFLLLAGAGAAYVCRAAAADTSMGLELTAENVELVLDEIRPYLMAGMTHQVSARFNYQCPVVLLWRTLCTRLSCCTCFVLQNC